MEGNNNMVLPTMDKIVCGAKEVLNWCKKRFAGSLHIRKQNIMLTILDVCKQIDKYKINGSRREVHASIFESNVVFKGCELGLKYVIL